MIVSEATQRALTEIIGQCFRENRYLDRMVSIIGVKFAYNTTADLIHHGMAHYFPALADIIGEKCLERYNILIKDLSGKNFFHGKNFIRIAIKDRNENDMFLKAAEEMLR